MKVITLLSSRCQFVYYHCRTTGTEMHSPWQVWGFWEAKPDYIFCQPHFCQLLFGFLSLGLGIRNTGWKFMWLYPFFKFWKFYLEQLFLSLALPRRKEIKIMKRKNWIPVQGSAVFNSYDTAFPAQVLYAALELIHMNGLDHSLKLCHLCWSEGDEKKDFKFALKQSLGILNSLPTYATGCYIILSNLVFLGMPWVFNLK